MNKMIRTSFLLGLFVLVSLSAYYILLPMKTALAFELASAEKENLSPASEINESKACLATDLEQGDLRAANEKEATDFAEVARQSEEFRRFREYLATEHTEFQLDEYPEVTIVGEEVNVSFAVEGGAGYSFFALVFDHKSAEILYTLSGLYAFVGENVSVIYQKNTNLIAELEITQAGEVVSGFTYDENGKRSDVGELLDQNQIQGFWDFYFCFEDCMVGMGVPIWVLTGVTIVCAVVCAGTAGLGCLACLHVAVSGYTSITTICFYECWGNW